MRPKMFWLVSFAWLLLVTNAGAFYDPGLQRWINRDPIQEAGSLNLYEHQVNDPVAHSDAFGKCPLVLGIPAALGIASESGAAVFWGGAAVSAAGGLAVGTAITTHGGGAGPRVRYQGPAGANSVPTSITIDIPLNPTIWSPSPGERRQQRRSPNQEKTEGKPDNQTGKKPDVPKPPDPPRTPPPKKPNEQDDWWNRPPWNTSPPKDLCPTKPSPGPSQGL